MFDKIKPLGDRVLIKRIEMEDTTPGGIIIPDAAKEKTQMGKVISVGQGKTMSDGKTVPVAVKAGETVFYSKYAGTEAGDEHLIISESELLGVVDNAF